MKLTRLQWSGRIAFEREVLHWQTNVSDDGLSPEISDAGGSFRTSLARHLETLDNPAMFYEVIFLRSFALMESHCKFVSHLCSTGDWTLIDRPVDDNTLDTIDDVRLGGGIEAWSEQLMSGTKQRWVDVYGGRSGLVEVSILRNAMMHGYSRASDRLIAGARARGVELGYGAGDDLQVTFAQLHEYRGRMRSFCRVLSDGIVDLSRGTHRDV